MPDVLICTCGHEWTATHDPASGLMDPGQLRCPKCGCRVTQPTAWGGTAVYTEPEPTRVVETDPPEATRVVETDKVVDVTELCAAGQEAVPRVEGYEILGELGRGGMGVVYQARQTKLNRIVGLKMVLAGAHLGKKGLARFRIEAEAVARLQHPNIVQIYEIGEQDGLPFFSLEYVDGGSLDRQIRGKPLPVREAAAVVEKLARAMDYAHEQGIIHRDLKPANVLLTKDGEPKITDFGLAKRLDEEVGQTRTGDVMGTPSYMAPEQAQGRKKDMGPATDVYALGAILYELLSNAPPFWAETAMDTLIRVALEEPVPPSRLRPGVPPDLEVICLKCLEKDPAKRYPRAARLADDLRRYLGGETIDARPATHLERGVKWARRRPALAALLGVSALAVVVVLIGSLAFNVKLNEANARLNESVVSEKQQRQEAVEQRQRAEEQKQQAEEQRRRADQQRQLAEEQRALAQREQQRANANYLKARHAVDLMLTRVGQEHLAHVPGMSEERRKLLEEALKFYEGIQVGEAADPSVRQETGRAYRRVGDIAGVLGDRSRAEKAYRQSVALFNGLHQKDPRDAAVRADLAAGHFQLGRLLRASGKPQDAREQFEQSRQLFERLHADDTRSPAYRSELGRTWNELGQLWRDRDEFQEAKTAFDKALDLQAALVAEHPDEPAYLQDLAGSYNDRGVLFRLTGSAAEAEKDYQEALKYFQKLEQQAPGNTEYRWKLAAAYHNVGTVDLTLAQQQTGAARAALLEQAEKALEAALDLRQKLTVSFPTVPVYQRELANGYSNLAAVRVVGNRPADADKDLRQAEAILRQLLRQDDKVPDLLSGLAGVLDNRALVARRQGDNAQAMKYLDEALPYLDAALQSPENRENQVYRQLLRNHYRVMAETLVQEGKAAEAARAAEEPARRFPDSGLEAYQTAALLTHLGKLFKDGKKLPPEKRAAQTDALSARAVQLLEAALAKGYAPTRPLDQDPLLAGLRDRADFQQLLKR